ncbi:hypothetical protein SAMN05428995_1052 [Loktanella sp. DSM 29012]|uniref:hypothetical protein n=1 Tax=Loktanella sp. DSM 29012 TaxID=1881056 RepID=UPI0008CC5DBE|nr:hypothetical protein [Loktanella sp. DSM 29012]SEQ52454.1 hypothetical protein SAMN05428995_1052 [Loktanella sp. DSM 29012]
MAIITKSDKLETTGEFNQTKMGSEQYVLLRTIHETNSYTLMTATAKEDDGSYIAFPDLNKLVAAAENVLGRGERCTDNWGRPYFICKEIDHPREIRDLANRIAELLDLPPVNAPWADEEMRDIYDEFSVSEDGEPAYLSDGVYVSSRGRLED